MKQPATTRQDESLQIRVVGWYLACHLANQLDRAGYHFSDTDCSDLQPGQYTGRPLLAAPDVGTRPWLVAWLSEPASNEDVEAGLRFAAVLEAISGAAIGAGLLLAAFCLGFLAIRLAAIQLAAAADPNGQDLAVVLAGTCAANFLLFAGAAKLVPALGHAWRGCQRGFAFVQKR